MEENRLQDAGKNSGSSQKKLMISVLVAGALLIAGLYFMVNQPKNFIVLFVLADLFLAALYIAVDSAVKLSAQQKLSEDAQYDNIFKSEKASYLLLKKTYEDLLYLIEKADESKDSDSERIIISQKAMAKAILNKNYENTNAVLHLNNDIRNMITELQDKVKENGQNNQEYQEKFTELFNEEIVAKQDRLFIELNNMEASLNNSLLNLSEKVSGFQEEIERLADHIAKINIETINELTKNITVLNEQTASRLVLDESTEKIHLEETSAAEISATKESISDEVFVSDEVSVSDEVFVSDEASVSDEIFIPDETSISDEASVEDLINSVLNDSPEVEQTVETKVLENESEKKEEASNPNKMMTPDDIEALIAGTLDDIGLDLNNLDKDPMLPGMDEMLSVEAPEEEMKLEELLPEKEPVMEKVSAAVQEEKKAGPDLSNPNKMMTPEDIAALLASM